jgi:hypothetical protein
MSLEKWVEYGWLRRITTSPDEIRGLLSIVDRGLKDAQVAQISADLRITATFSSALQCCTVALRACGFRPAGRVTTCESLNLSNRRLVHPERPCTFFWH